MQFINPILFSSLMLVSTTATESVALWSNTSSYIVGDQVRLASTHKIYECSVNNTGVSPDTSIDPVPSPKWLEIGADNAYSMFDNTWGSRTTAINTLTVQVSPYSAIDSLGLLNLLGSNVLITCTVGGVVKYTKNISLQTSIGVYDWKTYFLAPIVAEDDVVVTDLLPYISQVISITITGPGTVGIGNLSMGSFIDIGALEWSPKVTIVDYSKKTVDAFGNIVITQRAYSKRFSGRFIVQPNFVDQLASLLASIRSVPVVWIGSPLYSCLIVWGYFKEFEIEITYLTESYCSITIEGLV